MNITFFLSPVFLSFQRLIRLRAYMGNKYNHHLHNQNMNLYHKSTFLPMLCSTPSIKKVIIPKWEDRSMSFSGDPLSPKVSCIGQVERGNKIVGLPTPNKFNITTTKNNSNTTTVKYSKLKRIFSGMNRNSKATTSITSRENSVPISIEDMDPPLPVIKKSVRKIDDGGEMDNLWKRRSGGVALKILQPQQIQLNKHHHHHHVAPTTV